jgi:hypothetical protein
MIVPVIIGSDKTKLANSSGDQTAYPLYLTIGNLAKAKRRSVSLNSLILIGLLPDIHTLSTGGQHFLKEAYHAAMEKILRPLREPERYSSLLECADCCT